jgi:hypothetical protein
MTAFQPIIFCICNCNSERLIMLVFARVELHTLFQASVAPGHPTAVAASAHQRCSCRFASPLREPAPAFGECSRLDGGVGSALLTRLVCSSDEEACI